MKLVPKVKNKLLHQEYILLIQIVIEYGNRQLTIKSILLTLVAGAIALMFNGTLGIVYSFPAATLTASIDILSVAVVVLLLPVVFIVALFHERYEHLKMVYTSLATDIEEFFAKHNDSEGALTPYSIQVRSVLASYSLSRKLRARLLDKIDIHGYSFFWIITVMIIVAFVIDCLLPVR